MNMRRHFLAGVAASGILLGSSTPGFCDIGPGDLGDAAEHIADSIIGAISNLGDSLCAWLLMPFENLPTIELPAPAEVMLGQHPGSIPGTPDSGIATAEEIIEDQQARADSAEAAISAALAAGLAQQAQSQAFEALNLAPPISVVAGQQIGNQIAVVGVQAQTTAANLQANSVAMQAAEIMERKHAVEIEIAQMQQFANFGQPLRLEAETIRLAR